MLVHWVAIAVLQGCRRLCFCIVKYSGWYCITMTNRGVNVKNWLWARGDSLKYFPKKCVYVCVPTVLVSLSGVGVVVEL